MSCKYHKWLTAVLQCAAIACVFLSGCYTEEYLVASTGYYPLQQNAAPTYNPVTRNDHSLFHSLFNTGDIVTILGCALLAAMACGVILCILHLAAGDKRYAKALTATSVLQTILLGAWGLLLADSSWSNEQVMYKYYPVTLFYVMLGVCAVWVAVNLLGCRDKKADK